MCLAQRPQRSDTGEARTRGLSVSSQGLYHWATALPLRRWRCLKHRTTALVVIQGHAIIQKYMDEILRSVALPFCAITSDSTRHRITMPEHTSLEKAKNNVVRIGWSGMSTILTCLWHLWTKGSTHNNGIKKLLATRYSVAGDIDADPSAPNQKN